MTREEAREEAREDERPARSLPNGPAQVEQLIGGKLVEGTRKGK